MRFLHISQTTFLAIFLATVANEGLAATQQWNGSSNNFFGNPFNWTPFGAPGDGDTATITGGVPNAIPVILLSDTDALDGLTVNGGAQLRTNGNQLLVDDTLFSLPIQFDTSHTVVGAASNIVVNSGAVDGIGLPTTDFRADFVTIQNNGAVTLLSSAGAEPAKFWADRTINNLEGGFLRGSNGIVRLGGLLNNDGIIASLTGDFAIDPAPSGPIGSADLDGANEIGILSVGADTTLTINANITDSIDGQINIADGGRLKIVGDANVGTSDLSFGVSSRLEVTGELTFGQSDAGVPVVIDFSPVSNGARIEVGNAARGSVVTSPKLILIEDIDSAGGILRFTEGAQFTTDRFFRVGHSESGELIIENGAQVTAVSEDGTQLTKLGETASGHGVATVTGVGSVWKLSRGIHVGRFGEGMLTIKDGGRFETGFFFAALRPGSKATVQIDDAMMIVENTLYVGDAGQAEIRVENGGSISSKSTHIGTAFNGDGTTTTSGTAIVDGIGSIWNAETLVRIAGNGDFTPHPGRTGTLRVIQGGRFNSGGDVRVGGDLQGWESAELEIASGGLLDAVGDVTIYKDTATTGTSTLNLDEGELRAGTFRNEDVLNAAGNSRIRADLAGTVSIFFGDTSTNNITGDLTLDGDTLVEAGADFDGFGNLRLNGGHVLYLQDAASLIGVNLVNDGHVQLGEVAGNVGQALAETYSQADDASLTVTFMGDALDEFDRLGTKGDIELDGTLNIELADYDPLPGTSFEILNATSGSIVGEFAEIIQPSGAPVQFVADYNFSDVVLTAFFAGDADTDGDVDGADFLLIQRTDPSLIPIWEAQYGSTAGLLTGAQQVPEPTALLLMAFSLTILGTLRFS